MGGEEEGQCHKSVQEGMFLGQGQLSRPGRLLPLDIQLRFVKGKVLLVYHPSRCTPLPNLPLVWGKLLEPWKLTKH